MKEKRFEGIDALKAVAILMVVLVHAGLFGGGGTDFLAHPSLVHYMEYLMRLCCEGVPIFVFINGFLLINKPYDKIKHRKRILNFLKLILIWSFIYLIVAQLETGAFDSFGTFISELFNPFFKSEYIGFLWFLSTLLIVYLVLPILKTLHDNERKMYNYLFLLCAVFSVGINLLSLIVNVFTLISHSPVPNAILEFTKYFSPFSSNVVYYLFYFMLGGLIFEHQKWFKNKVFRWRAIGAGVLSLAMGFSYCVLISHLTGKLVSDSFNYTSINCVFYVIGLYALFANYQSRGAVGKIVSSAGQNSLGIYLIHRLVISHLIMLFAIPRDSLVQRIGFAMLAFVVSYLIVLVMRKIPVVRKTIS